MQKLMVSDSVAKTIGVIAAVVTIVSVTGVYLAPMLGPIIFPPTPAYTTTVSGENMTFFSDAGFKITYPTALTDYILMGNSSSSPKPTLEIFLNPNDTLDKITALTSDTYLGQRVTLQDVIADNFESVTTFQDFYLISRGNVTLGGLPAYEIVYTANQQHWNPNMNEIVQLMWVFGLNSNGRVYSVCFEGVSNDYNTYLPQAQQIINSFSYT
jgi:hypothetical protein